MTTRPYNIQRGRIRPGYSRTARYSEAVDNDYMGSSEFEWGALPASLRRLQSEREELSAIQAPDIRDAGGRPLLLYGNFHRHEPAAYREMIRAVAHGEAHTREHTGFGDQIRPKPITVPARVRGKAAREQYVRDAVERTTNVWWDIDNDVLMSFESAFMTDLPQLLANSWEYMDRAAAARAGTPSSSLSGSAGATQALSPSNFV